MQAAQVAAQSVQDSCPVTVVDSLLVSMGLGNLCITAAELAADGESLDSIVSNVIDRRNRTKLYGALDTLEYLKKGGRIGNARALLGSMLAIKPVLEVRDGSVDEAGEGRSPPKARRVPVARAEGGPLQDLAALPGGAPPPHQLLTLPPPLGP